jgi:hypothetical protein
MIVECLEGLGCLGSLESLESLECLGAYYAKVVTFFVIPVRTVFSRAGSVAVMLYRVFANCLLPTANSR